MKLAAGRGCMTASVQAAGGSAASPARPGPLHLEVPSIRVLLEQQGPSLGLWRAAEVAALPEQALPRPILDVGRGDGLVTSLVYQGVDLGLDPHGAALSQAARRGVYHRLEAVAFEDAGLAEGSMASVVSNPVLEHVPHLDAVLRAVSRVLRFGGQLVLTAPTQAFGGWLAIPGRRYADWRHRGYQHRSLPSAESWAREVERVDLEVELVRPCLRRGLVALWDALDLVQQVRFGCQRIFGALWRRIPPAVLDRLAGWASRLDLSAPPPGGGHLILARRVGAGG